MATISAFIDNHYRGIITGLVGIIVFFAVSCTFHDTIPVCHYLFGCDHAVHVM